MWIMNERADLALVGSVFGAGCLFVLSCLVFNAFCHRRIRQVDSRRRLHRVRQARSLRHRKDSVFTRPRFFSSATPAEEGGGVML